MTPAVVIDNSTDFHPPSYPESSTVRTLLLAPPSIASHEEKLREVLSSYDRQVTDLQMLDRLSAGLVTLPEVTYDLVVILSDANGTRSESSQLLGRDVFGRIVRALKAGGKLQAKDGSSHPVLEHDQLREAILAGLVAEGGFLMKPNHSASDAIPLKLSRRKDKGAAVSSAGPPVETSINPGTGKRKGGDVSQSHANGIGFVDFSSDFDDPIITGEDEDDDELIDEDTLLTEEDLKRPLNIRRLISLLQFSMLIHVPKLLNVHHELANVEGPAKTVHAVLHRRLLLRIKPSE